MGFISYQSYKSHRRYDRFVRKHNNLSCLDSQSHIVPESHEALISIADTNIATSENEGAHCCVEFLSDNNMILLHNIRYD